MIIGNNRYDSPTAERRLAEGRVDLVAFGRPFISNPDLVSRLQANMPLQAWDEATFYGGGRQGYTDHAPAEGTLIYSERTTS